MATEFELAPGCPVGGNHKTFFIAEGGINHQGDVAIAKQLISASKQAGADCIKFQKRTITANFTKAALARPYNSVHSFGATYGEHKQHLELSEDQWREMKEFADKEGIILTGSGMDEEAIDMLDRLDVPFFKIGSPDLYNLPLLKHAALKGKPLVISTGMADLETVRRALDVVREHNSRIVLLQCTSTYPLPVQDTNLRVIGTFAREFPDVVVGYSGHESGTEITLAAVALGAKLVERHVTLDKSWKGNDHKASLNIEELTTLIQQIRNVELALGDGVKVIQPSEQPVFLKTGKTIVAKRPLEAGDALEPENVAVKVSDPRGLNPINYFSLVGTGKRIKRAIPEDHPIGETDLD